jgi:hypothetical protein
MSASIVSSNLTSGFIDLATFDELEKYMYGGQSAVTYFVRETRKSTWFTQVPTALQKGNGSADFGQEWSANITRAGDYLLQVWLRTTIPSVTLNPNLGANYFIRWTRNLMHNLLREASVTFNDLSAEKIDSFFLDFWTAFTVPAGKRVGYDNMIGNISALTNPTPAGVATRAITLNLPLPFFFTRDTGKALPVAALPYNDMKIQLWFRNWDELLIVDNIAAAPGTNPSAPPTSSQLVSIPTLSQTYVWANYAIVSNDERKRMGCAPRDILIEQVQYTSPQSWNPISNPNPSYDIRFSHAIKALFFSVWNTTTSSERSNYVTTSPVDIGGSYVNFSPAYPSATDPIQYTSILYENTARMQSMGSDYFSLVQPYYQPSAVIPTVSGYHMYSYSLDFGDLDPKGSTNYGKLTNISIVPVASQFAQEAAAGTLNSPGGTYPQTYSFVTVGVNNNIIRISGGALGFPVL